VLLFYAVRWAMTGKVRPLWLLVAQPSEDGASSRPSVDSK
jgi:hypothetical protein